MDTVTTSIQWRESAGSRAHLIKSKQTEQTTNIDKGRKMHTTTEKTGTGEINPNLKTDRITALEDYEKAIGILDMVGYEGFKRIVTLIQEADEIRGVAMIRGLSDDIVDFDGQDTPYIQKQLRKLWEKKLLVSLEEAGVDLYETQLEIAKRENELEILKTIHASHKAEQRGETLETES